MNRLRMGNISSLAALALGVALVGGPGRPARAEVRLPSIFGSHMVLQQGQKDKVWGWAEPGEEVSVTIDSQSKTARADRDGKWSVTLDPMMVGGPHTMTVKGRNTITFDDVLIGEVWLCSGQSNMAWDVANANDADLESRTAKSSRIRLISVPQVGTQEPQSDFRGRWEVCNPESVKRFSAVGYFFGRQLHQTLGVPIGLIDDAWGGSACEAWIRPDRLAADDAYKSLLESWAQRERNLPQARAKFEKDLADWNEAVAKAKKAGTPPPRRPQSPDEAMSGNQRPGNIYNGVLKPTIGYGLRGAIWYQGESNAGRAYQYRTLFPLMIQSWRDEWGIGDFSFYWVQLADFMPEKPEPSDSAWAELREAQTMTMSKLPNTGQAVIIDLGEAKDIHPRNKLDVAKRLARWALACDYGLDVVHRSPTYKSMERQDNKVVLTFDHVGGGLQTFDVADPRGFAVASSDRKFVWAKAKIAGRDKIEVWSEEVSEPASVRYAWADNPVCNVYSREGLPLTPFRTDDWPGVTSESRPERGARAARAEGGLNVPPSGFTALFNGRDLTNWHGMPQLDPRKLAAMSDDERAKAIEKWTADARQHWSVDGGDLVNDGHGVYLTTDKEFGDIELLIDYKTVPKADSGIYLRATPQVQIWDSTESGPSRARGASKGSGGLFNNANNAPGRDPLVLADRPFGEWNRFRIIQVGARTTVYLNDKLVVDHANMENFWDRKSPLFARGPIQLQTHGGEIRWRNVFVREIPPEEANKILAEHGTEGYRPAFDGKSLDGWGGPVENYEVVDGAIRCKPGKGGVIYYNKEVSDFMARVEFRLPPGGNNGLAIRYPGQGDTAYSGMCELQVLDDSSPKYARLDPRQYHGSVYGMVPAKRGYLRPVGQWNFQEVTVKGPRIKVELNGTVIVDADVSEVTEFMGGRPHPGKDRTSGFFGFAGHNEPVEFRAVAIKPLTD